MRLIIAGGGTGGHVFPAISIAQQFLESGGSNEVLFVGTVSGLEAKVVRELGYEIEFISAGGLLGKGVVGIIKGIVKSLGGLFQSASILRRFKPGVVLGVGGYVSGPMVLTASIFRTPTMICEQNIVPGITNRILSKLVDKVAVTFEESRNHFPAEKTVVTGNPIRKQILQSAANMHKNEALSVLILGGSLGASKLNKEIPTAFSLLSRRDFNITHQTGERDRDAVQESYRSLGVEASVVPFISDMGAAYAGSDLVIGRSGAGTIAEITALGIPSILIPYPYATHDHQSANARALEQYGAATLIKDDELTPQLLALTLEGLLQRERLDEMGEKAKSLGRPEAAESVVNLVYELGRETPERGSSEHKSQGGET